MNAVSRPGKTKIKPDSGSLAVPEHELELSQNHVPVSTTRRPVLDNFPAGKIEHFTQGIIVGKAGLVFGDLPELAVQVLDDIGRVYDFPNLGGICEKGAQNIPILLPAFDAGGILFAPLFLKRDEIFQSLILGDGGVDLLQIHLFALLGVYLFFLPSAIKLHFSLGVFLHFIIGADRGT